MESANREDYLRAVYHLMEENKEVKSVDLADYLNVTKPSISEMLKELGNEGLIEHKKYSKVKLTARGHKIARSLTSKHRLIEKFLKDMLKVDTKKIHAEAHRLEHAFSDESINRLRKILGNPMYDPHGKPIPRVS